MTYLHSSWISQYTNWRINWKTFYAKAKLTSYPLVCRHKCSVVLDVRYGNSVWEIDGEKQMDSDLESPSWPNPYN